MNKPADYENKLLLLRSFTASSTVDKVHPSINTIPVTVDPALLPALSRNGSKRGKHAYHTDNHTRYQTVNLSVNRKCISLN